MVEYDRLNARCRADVEENLLRGIESDRSRLNSKLKLLQGEIDGAHKAIEVKQHQIDVALQHAAEVQAKLDKLGDQARALAGESAA